MLLDRGSSGKYLPCGDALEDLNNATGGEFWMGSAEEVDVILVHSHRLYLDLVSLLYAYRSFSDYPDDLFVEKRLPVLDGEDDVVMNLPRAVVPFSDSAFIVHPCSITKQGAPVASYRELSS